jgi:hypothetical protein
LAPIFKCLISNYHNQNFTELYGTINGVPVTYSNISGITASLGIGATFDIVKSANAYSPTINRSGNGYSVGNTITVYGNLIGGTYSTHDLTITVASLGNVTLGNIATVTFSYSGWTGESPLQDTQVVICNTQNLGSKFTDNSWILDVNLLIVDECHGVNSDANLSKIINKIKTPNKFGFTGTLSDKPLNQWKTLGVFGPVIYEKKSKELRDEKYLSNVNINVLKLNKK